MSPPLCCGIPALAGGGEGRAAGVVCAGALGDRLTVALCAGAGVELCTGAGGGWGVAGGVGATTAAATGRWA
jgi:hypothetical protein